MSASLDRFDTDVLRAMVVNHRGTIRHYKERIEHVRREILRIESEIARRTHRTPDPE